MRSNDTSKPPRFIRAPGVTKIHLLDGRGLDTRQAICGYETPRGGVDSEGWSGEATDDLCLKCLRRTVGSAVPWRTYRLVGEWEGIRKEISIIGQYDYTTRRLTESLGGTVREGIRFDAVGTATRELLNASAEEWHHSGMPPVWSKGEISIVDVETGEQVQPTMEEK